MAIFLLVIFAQAACTSYGPWIGEDNAEKPWCAAGELVRNEYRRLHSAFADGSESRYVGCNGEIYSRKALWESIDQQLANSELAASWPKDILKKVDAPADMYLVSIRPEIVVFCKRNMQKPQYINYTDSEYFKRGLIVGTEMRCEDPVGWTSIKEIRENSIKYIDENHHMFKFDGATILLERKGEVWSVDRK